jgi:hypothetical protein
VILTKYFVLNLKEILKVNKLSNTNRKKVMSNQIQYRCPHCNNILSDYSKKGFELLHTKIGLPFFTCDHCSNDISTGMKSFSSMSNFEKTRETLKISLNIILISLIFGGLMIGVFCFQFIGGPFDNVIPDLLFCFFMGFLIVGFIKYLPYRKYNKWVEKMTNQGETKISISIFRKKYPDW